MSAQQIHVADGGLFFVGNSTMFTTSGATVEVSPAGSFVVQAGNLWGSSTEYVEGAVTAIGSGETKLPVGDQGVYAPVVVVHSDEVRASYSNQAPSAGSPGVGVDAISEVEYWQMSGTGIVTLPWNEASDITTLVNDHGGKLSALAIVGLSGDTWNLVSQTQTNVIEGDLRSGSISSDPDQAADFDAFEEFTFGIDAQLALAVNELFLTTGIEILANPVMAQDKNIRFQTTGDLQGLSVDLYDLRGRLVRSYETISGVGHLGELPVSGVKSGLYFAKFVQDGKQGVKKIIIE